MDGTPAIEAVGLTKMYGGFAAISNVNLTVRKGEFMGLLGPNGAGKSTTLKAITGLLMPTSGSVRIAGIDIHDHRRAMEHVGCVIETPEPYPGFTPAEIMEYVGRLYGLDSREIEIRARDVLETMRMWEWRDKKIGEFSKGRGMIEIRQTLAELKHRNVSLLISTHILSEVSEICGSVTMIRDGKVIASGDVAKLIHGTGADKEITLEIRTLRPFTPQIVSDLTRCQGVTGSERMGDYTLKLQFSGSTEDQAHVNEVAFRSGLGILALNEKGANLEDLYMELTKGDEIQ